MRVICETRAFFLLCFVLIRPLWLLTGTGVGTTYLQSPLLLTNFTAHFFFNQWCISYLVLAGAENARGIHSQNCSRCK